MEPYCHIAVVAKDTEAKRKPVLDQPNIDAAAHLPAMLGATAFNMIDRQKLVGRLTATGTYSAVVSEYQSPSCATPFRICVAHTRL